MFRAIQDFLRRHKRRAVIIGGSMSGLFSAAFLRQIGWDVDVYERSSVELVGRGAGITGHPELLQALEASGAGTKDLGIEVPKRIALDRDGRVTEERPLRQILTSWDRLQQILRGTIDPAHYHLGWNFERVDQDERGVRVQFSGGRVELADILIGGDGIRSSVRAQMAPEVQPIYAGYYIWRGAPKSRPRAGNVAHYLSAVHVLFAETPRVITYPSRAPTMICGRSAASISSGTGSPTPISCATCARTRTACSTNIRCRRR
jgi:2-polyprenyl-6-methoxyphenol hydroxylase-like FAD-dependent oxidoreductase